MSSFPKALRTQWAGRESGGKIPSTDGKRPEVLARRSDGRRPSVPKATSNEPEKPLSARGPGRMAEQENATVVDDHSKNVIDHSVHWSQLSSKKPHKNGLVEQALKQMERLKKNDDLLDKLKEDSAAKLQNAVLMSSVAGNIVKAIDKDSQAKKTQIRTAKSMLRDAALDKLARVMKEEEEAEIAKKEEAEAAEQEEEEHNLNFEESPARNRERKDGYKVISQRRRSLPPPAPRRERKGKHPLDLIAVLEVVPNTPTRTRERSVDRDPHQESITVHAADFIKYGNDVKMLRTLKVEPPPMSEPVALEASVAVSEKQEHAVEELAPEVPFVPFDPWAGKGYVDVRYSQNDTGINQVWFPPSPDKADRSQSQSSTRAPSSESVYDRLFRQGNKEKETKQSRSRQVSKAGIAHSQIPHSRGSSKSGSLCGSRAPSQPPSRSASRPSSARLARPNSARQHGDAPPSSARLPSLPP